MMNRIDWIKYGLASLVAAAILGGCSSETSKPAPAPAAAKAPTPAPPASIATTPPVSDNSGRPANEEDSRALANDLFSPQGGADANAKSPPLDSPSTANPFKPFADALGAVGQTLTGGGSQTTETEDEKGSVLGSIRNAVRKGIVEAEAESARTAELDNSQQTN